MMTMARLECTFCGAAPVSTNHMDQPTCFRHTQSFDLTGDGGGGRSSGTKRSIHDLDGYLSDDGFVVSPLEEVDDFAVPHLEGVKGKGKKKARGPVVKQRECMICMGKFRVAGVTCGAGDHHTCKGCTRDYITKTLGSKGTVYFDRVPCVQPSCWSLIPAKEAEGALTKKKLAEMEKKQWDLAYLLGGEVDPSSQVVLSKHTKPCPNCKVPIEHGGACDHMTCVICSHEFWYSCSDTCKNYPFHAAGCSKGYTQAPVVNE